MKNRISYRSLRNIIRPLNLKGKSGYEKYWKSHQRPDNIPARPDYYYPDEWKGWDDLTGYKRTSNKRFRPFDEARKYVRKLGLPNEKAWREYCKSGEKPEDIPSKPDFVYRGRGWVDWYDWLGIQKGSPVFPQAVTNDRRAELPATRRHTRYLPFTNAREYVH